MTAALTGSQISLFLIVLSRVGGLVLSAPIVGDMQVPRLVKASLAIALSLVLVQLPGLSGARLPTAMAPFILLVLVQLVIGIALGFVARAIFFAVQTAGHIVSLQAGLSLGAIFNPLTREPDPVFAQLYTIIAAMTFLAVNGDLWVVASLARSFDLAPITAASFPSHLVSGVVTAALTVTQLGLQIALPIVASLFAASVVLGVVSRSLPQLNVFVLSMPLNLLLVLVALAGSLAGVVIIIDHLTNELPQTMLGLTLGGQR